MGLCECDGPLVGFAGGWGGIGGGMAKFEPPLIEFNRSATVCPGGPGGGETDEREGPPPIEASRSATVCPGGCVFFGD